MKKRVLIIAKILHQSRVLREKLDVMLQTEMAVIGEKDILETMKEFQPQHVVCYLNRTEEARLLS